MRTILSRLLLAVCCITLLAIVSSASARSFNGRINFTVSMEKPGTHYYHVVMECRGVDKETLDFKLPAWTPGYYWLVNFAKNAVNFNVKDGRGTPLAWNKTTKNTWHVQVGKAPIIIVEYDVYAFTQSVADPFLDDDRGYISPAGVFMYIDGALRLPATVTLKPAPQWTTISTGLDPLSGSQHTFFAHDFDALYDSPILLGNHEVLSFSVQGIQHRVVLEEPEKFNHAEFTADLKRMVEAAVAIIGDIPYRHYTFLIMGEGQGGLEHQNSTAVFSGGGRYDTSDREGYKRWMAFLTHEYFHLYNIKAIRPIALGPFNYDQENYTNMLWMSEGFTVYYEYLILNRAGILSREDCLGLLRGNIMSYENIPGHLIQSATASSFDTWIQFFNRSDNAANTTISYYDKGAALGMLLDLKIRNDTRNRRSLDDVMRSLYQTYYKEKKRGFTDDEFRKVCEEVAGSSLEEIFRYASTVEEIDYQKYFSYAGLEIDVAWKKLPLAYFGATVMENDDGLVVAGVSSDSPAWNSGLNGQDIILSVNGTRASRAILNDVIGAATPGDTISLNVMHRGKIRRSPVVLGEKTTRSFLITPGADPQPLQTAILKSWLRE